MAKKRTRGKKYNPRKRGDLVNPYRTLQVTREFHDVGILGIPGWIDEPMVVDKRTSLAKKVSIYTADQINNYEHEWSAYICVMCRDAQGNNYTKSENLVFTQSYRHVDLVEYLNQRHQDLIKQTNPNHRICAPWIIAPTPTDWSEALFYRFMEEHGVWQCLAQWQVDKLEKEEAA